jgi:MOSC domain-containing protein YiiM
MAQVQSITYRPEQVDKKTGEYDKPPRFPRVSVTQARLVAGHGIDGDAKAGRHPRRHLNILSRAWVQARKAEGFAVKPGAFGEQLVIEGLAIEELAPGDRLRIGNAELEITQPRDGCVKVELVHGRVLPACAVPIGMLARVTRGGDIQVGDHVLLLAEESLVAA